MSDWAERAFEAIEALDDPTPSNVDAATREFDARAVASAAGSLGANAASGSQPGVSAFTVTAADLLAAEGTEAAFGEVTAELAILRFDAAEAGISGNAIAVFLVGDLDPEAPPVVTVDGTQITVHMEAEADSDDIVDAVNALPAAAVLVTASDPIPGGGFTTQDVYLSGGQTKVTLATLSEGDIVYGAEVFFPENFDATTTLHTQVGPSEGLFYEGDPDPTNSADNLSDGVAVSNVPITVFTTPMRVTDPTVALTVTASSEAGAIPTQGEMLLCVDIRTPA